MTKAQETAKFFVIIAAIYTALWFGVIPTGKVFHEEVVPVIPFWALVSFGSYSLFSLGWGIITFKDKEEKYQELLKEIAQAKEELRAKGVDIDE